MMQPTDTPPKLPDLPAMTGQGAGTSVYQPQPYPVQGIQPGTRHLRRLLGYMTGGGFILLALIVIVQNVAPRGWRPSDMLAGFESSLELETMKGKQPTAADGSKIMTQGDYEKEIARARAEGAASVQYEYQEKLTLLQSDVQRVNDAYKSLYDRTTQLATVAFTMEQDMQRYRAATVQQGQAGRASVAMLKDMWCAVASDQTACASASNDRREMVTELNNLSGMDVGSRVQALMSEIPDPASLVVKRDLDVNGAPGVRRDRPQSPQPKTND